MVEITNNLGKLSDVDREKVNLNWDISKLRMLNFSPRRKEKEKEK